MSTKTDIRREVLVRLGKDTTSAWTSATIVNSWVDQAHRWASGFKKWPFTEGRVSTTFASLVTSEDGYLRGEYPEGWKSDSIRQLVIGGDRVQKLNWEDFQMYLENHEDDNERIFSDFGRSYYINPRIDLSGSTTVWGQYTPAILDDESASDDTVFRGEEEGNQAIIEESVSYALRRDGKETEYINHHKIAEDHLNKLWERITAEQFAYQSKDRGMFTRVDILNGGYYDDELDTNQF